jgi:hypothetical protein
MIPTRLYCTGCETPTVLCFKRFRRSISHVKFDVQALPILFCKTCGLENLPDRTRAAICRLHFKAEESGIMVVQTTRQKVSRKFSFALETDFNYDPDDYYYLPGLIRDGEDGFLTPVFFNKVALLKFTAWPGYSLRMCSKSYGTIWKGDEYSIPFGINRNGHLIMWLGDLDKLPIDEQRYLRSENIPSDHDIGSEFYDGQIECIFTKRKPEDQFFHAWLGLMNAIELRHGVAIDSLREESLAAVDDLVPPLTGQDKEILQKCDIFNKVTLETLQKPSLAALVQKEGLNADNKGSLKLLETLLVGSALRNAAKLLCPLFVIYDLRVLESHRHGINSYAAKVVSAATRLGLSSTATLHEVYSALLDQGTAGLAELASACAATK